MVSKAVANAQKKVEAHNFDIRKHVLEYDDVMNRQREVLYTLRRSIITAESPKEILLDMADELVDDIISEVAHEKIYPEEWDIEYLNDFLGRQFGAHIKKTNDHELEIEGKYKLELEDCNREKLYGSVIDAVCEVYQLKEEMIVKELEIDTAAMRHQEKIIMLQVLDTLWKDHLLGMDHLKEGIGLRGYAQKNPLTEYKKEGFTLFSNLMAKIKEETTEYLFKVQVRRESEFDDEDIITQPKQMVEHRGNLEDSDKPETVRRIEEKVGRNDPCPCGSGKKYKKCHGK
jgi:preprotein translocase subunit SecA